jgi:hypothetical protein
VDLCVWAEAQTYQPVPFDMRALERGLRRVYDLSSLWVGLMAPFDGLRAGFEVAPFQNADVFNGRALCGLSLVAEL